MKNLIIEELYRIHEIMGISTTKTLLTEGIEDDIIKYLTKNTDEFVIGGVKQTSKFRKFGGFPNSVTDNELNKMLDIYTKSADKEVALAKIIQKMDSTAIKKIANNIWTQSSKYHNSIKGVMDNLTLEYSQGTFKNVDEALSDFEKSFRSGLGEPPFGYSKIYDEIFNARKNALKTNLEKIVNPSAGKSINGAGSQNSGYGTVDDIPDDIVNDLLNDIMNSTSDEITEETISSVMKKQIDELISKKKVRVNNRVELDDVVKDVTSKINAKGNASLAQIEKVWDGMGIANQQKFINQSMDEIGKGLPDSWSTYFKKKCKEIFVGAENLPSGKRWKKVLKNIWYLGIGITTIYMVWTTSLEWKRNPDMSFEDKFWDVSEKVVKTIGWPANLIIQAANATDNAFNGTTTTEKTLENFKTWASTDPNGFGEYFASATGPDKNGIFVVTVKDGDTYPYKWVDNQWVAAQ